MPLHSSQRKTGKDLTNLERSVCDDIKGVLKIVEPVQRPQANKLRKQVEADEESGSYRAAAEAQEELFQLLRVLHGGGHAFTFEAQLKLADLKARAKAPGKNEEAMSILRKMRETPSLYLEAGFGQRVDRIYEQLVGFHDASHI